MAIYHEQGTVYEPSEVSFGTSIRAWNHTNEVVTTIEQLSNQIPS
jgi:hypothetical protein